MFEIGSSSLYFTPQITPPGSVNGYTMPGIITDRSIEARGISLLNGQFDIEFNRPIRVLDESFADRNPTIHIPVSARSSFGRSILGILIAPVSETEDIVVINPSNAAEYAFEGELFYARHVQNPHWANTQYMNSWGVSAAIRVVSQLPGAVASEDHPFIAEDRFVPCAISTNSDTSFSVPNTVFEQLMSSIEGMGISVTTDGSGVVLNRVSAERLSELPKLEYYMMSETGQQIRFAEVLPAQYVEETIDNGRYRLMVFGDRVLCSMDLRILKHLVVHIDVQNNRIGFGEPLVEL